DLLRVVQLRERTHTMVAQVFVIEEDACDDERPGERASAGLVSACDVASAEPSVEPQQPLARLRRLQPALLPLAHPRQLLRQPAPRGAVLWARSLPGHAGAGPRSPGSGRARCRRP